MLAARWLIRDHFRRRWISLLPLIVVVALGAGGAFTSLGAADRTAHAYSRYLDDAAVGDVVLNPSLRTAPIDTAIRNLPGVLKVTSDAFLNATIDEGEARTRDQLDHAGSALAQVRGSTDGRYTSMDRPALQSGRMSNGASEVLVSKDLAVARGIRVGDVIPLAFWSNRDDTIGDLQAVLTPVGVEHVTVVGVVVLADEVLPDGLYPRGRVILSSELTKRYDCLPEAPPADATEDAVVATVLPDGCASSYGYYSIAMSNGAAAVHGALDAFAKTAGEQNAGLPQSLLELSGGYNAVATTTSDEQARVERAMRPTVTALFILGLGAGAVTVVLVALMVARELRRREGDQRDWWRLGMSSWERLVVAVVPSLIAVVAGVVGALAAAWALSPIGPVGAVRSLEPSPARELSVWVLLAVGVVVVVLVAAVTLLANRATRRVARTAEVVRSWPLGRLARSSARPAVDEGMRAAYGSRRDAGLTIGSGGAAVAALVAALVFGASLDRLLATPSAYGWPWDIGVMGGYGYGAQDLDAARASLMVRTDVARWTGLGFGTFTVDDVPTVTMVGLGPPSSTDLTVVSGRLPAGADEIALGAKTADNHGVGVGGHVTVAGQGLEPRSVTVTALVVLPALGPYQADRATPGSGMLLPSAMFDAATLADQISFFGIETTPDADPHAVLLALHDDFVAWGVDGDRPFELAAPLRPPEVSNADSMRSVPLFVGALLALAAGVSLPFALAASVRVRRRQVATLRAIGFTSRQVGWSVLVQAIATTGAALLIGLPAGLFIGRFAWRGFATQLGVGTDASMPIARIAAAAMIGLSASLLVAILPARSAGRSSVQEALRAA